LLKNIYMMKLLHMYVHVCMYECICMYVCTCMYMCSCCKRTVHTRQQFLHFFHKKKCHKFDPTSHGNWSHGVSFRPFVPKISPTEHEHRVPGASAPVAKKQTVGPLGESNPRPPPPEGGIIPLDQADNTKFLTHFNIYIIHSKLFWFCFSQVRRN